jgi:predicted permease
MRNLLAAVRERLIRLWQTIAGGRHDRDLDAELALHETLAAEAAARRGLGNADARRSAAIAAGGRAQALERLRDQRRLPWLEDLRKDVAFAGRMFRRMPLLALLIVVTLAIGIGANVAIFSIVNGVILQPLHYPDPDRLVFVDTHDPGFRTAFPLSPAEYLELRASTRAFADVGAFTTREVNLLLGDRPLRARAAFVDDRLLRALQVPVSAGRGLTAGETEVHQPWFPGSEPPPAAVAIVSSELWQRAFARRPILGQSIDVDGRRREVIGVMAPGATLLDARIDVWLPLGLNPETHNFRGYHILSVVGRLRSGVTVDAARRDIDALVDGWGDRHHLPANAHVFNHGAPGVGHLLHISPLRDVVLGGVTRSIWILQAAAVLVWLVACINLAGLLVARAEARSREFALRTALGAGAGRLLRQGLAEGLLLAACGGLLGAGVARAALAALLAAAPGSLPRVQDIRIDADTLTFAVVVSLVTGAAIGLPAFRHMWSRSLTMRLKEGGDRGNAGAGRLGRRALIVAEVALASMLATGGVLLVRTVHNLSTVDAGFDRSRLMTFSVSVVARQKVDAPEGFNRASITNTQTFDRILTSLRVLPGVESVSAMADMPPAQSFQSEATVIDGALSATGTRTQGVDYYQSVMSDYFRTMRIPIVRGRAFDLADTTANGMVAIVNARFAETFWPGRDPIGLRVKPAWGDWVPWFTVIGVAADVKQSGVDRASGTELYFLVDQMAAAPSPLGRAPDTMHIVLRTSQRPEQLMSTIERTVHEIDPTAPVTGVQSMESVFADSIRRPLLLATLIGVFAALALLLAAIGTYGVLSYWVIARQREFGIRLALGASRRQVLADVLLTGLRLAAIGAACGVAASAAASRLLTTMLFHVSPTDMTTTVIVIAAVGTGALAACAWPAYRASRTDPGVMLRD